MVRSTPSEPDCPLNVPVERPDRRPAGDHAELHVAQGDDAVGAEVDGRELVDEVLQRDRGVDDAVEAAVGAVQAARQHDLPFAADAAHQRLGHDDARPGIARKLDEVRPVGQVGAPALGEAEAVDDVAARVGGAQPVQRGQALALAQDERLQRAVAERRFGG
jgi:hypothetical protein